MSEALTHPLAAADAAACELPRRVGPVQPCPLRDRFTALEALVVDDDDQPVAAVGVELRRSAREVMRCKTARDGVARFEGIEPGTYELGLVALDREAWSPIDHTPLADATASAAATWHAPSVAPTPTEHTVAPGDSIASLAQRYGYLPDALWSAPENAALAAVREDRNVLLPGDRVALPPRPTGGFSAAAGLRHRIRRKGATEALTIRFLDVAGAPRGGVAYLFEVDNARCEALPVREGATDERGVLRQRVPPDATVARVTLATELGFERYVFALGHVDPIDSPSGLRARLESLGYLPREGEPPPSVEGALRSFQRDHALAVSGVPDAATLDALRAAYHP